MIFGLFFMVVIGGIFAFCRNSLVPFWNKKNFSDRMPGGIQRPHDPILSRNLIEI